MHGRRGWNRIRSIHGVVPALLVGGAAACSCAGVVASEKAPPSRRPVVDPAVVQAGGACRGCRDPQCHSCRHGGVHRHHHGCRDGACHPHCPVRPQEFGFYGTQWRRWPGQGVVPASNLQDATPTRPPKSAVPGPDEESRGPRPGELPAPDVEEPSTVEPPAAEPPAAEPPEPAAAPEPAQLPPAEPSARPAEDEPVAPAPPPAEPPAKAPPATKPEGDDLFDESATGPVRRRFVGARPAVPAEERPQTAVRPAGLVRPSPTPPSDQPAAAAEGGPRVPRVPFDPTAESARPRR
jgi:hypothetical protein